MICNRCGNSCLISYDTEHEEFYGNIVHYSAGYNSPVLPDGYSYTFSLCERCISDIIVTLKNPPTVVDYMTGEKIPYAEFKEWLTKPNGEPNV